MNPDPTREAIMKEYENRQEEHVVSLWGGEWCMWCSRDWAWDTGCDKCNGTYDKLKAQDRLPRRREAVMATRAKL